MKLSKALKDWEERDSKNWPGPSYLNFKNKSKFVGFRLGEVTITPEMLESKKWAVRFESHDEEFNKAVRGLVEELGDGA